MSTLYNISVQLRLARRNWYKAAVADIATLLDLDPKRGSEEYERLEFLSVLVEAYEDEHGPINKCSGTPESVVAFMLEQHGMTRTDLAPLMSGKARVSEFFSGKRRLSVHQMPASSPSEPCCRTPLKHFERRLTPETCTAFGQEKAPAS